VGGAPSVLARVGAGVALLATLSAYDLAHVSLPDTSTWGDVAVIALLLMPAVFALVYLVLPLWRARESQLLLLGAALAVLGFLFTRAHYGIPANFAKLAAMTALAFWFLRYFETVLWVALVALIVPWVDAYSVWRGPTNNIVHNHRQVFSTLSFAFPIPGEHNAANLGLPDLLFFALFLAASARFRLRTRLTWLALVASFGVTITLAVWGDVAGLPALPGLSVGFLLPNADLIWRAFRGRGVSAASEP
jgi:hypothetical protein